MKFVKDFVIPVVVLTVICVVVSAALVFTYQATKPIIDEAKNAEANAARAVVLPGASGFEEVELTAEIEGAVDAYQRDQAAWGMVSYRFCAGLRRPGKSDGRL